ncbi:hypothetical protein [Dermabacter hominis]|uniref:hypothetical protein n=1 Tax=Dermabacter hominis TaxID=36740 RepID=UPI00242D09D7|nr:hypothetical protein [Dermabacter hominis]
MNTNSHRPPRGSADATEKLDAPLGADPTEVLAPVASPDPTVSTPTARPARTSAPGPAAASTPVEAPGRQSRQHPRSATAPVVIVLGLVASALLAIFAWGGMFSTAQLACVIVGAALFALTGIVAVRTCTTTGALVAAWILAFVLLFAPLLVWIVVQGGAAVTSTLIFGAIGMWVSGVAVVALVVAVLGTYLHARAAAR